MPDLAHLAVSRQGYGAMGLSSVYGRAEDEQSTRTLHRAVDLGITFFDTATAYGAGHNETLIGRALRDRRKGLVIASKFVHTPKAQGESPIRARDAVEASLKRLGLDYIDLYYLHRVDPQIPIEEVSIAWVLSKGVVPIPGARHIAHLEANCAANDLVLDAESVAELEETFVLGSTVGDRYPADQLKLVPPQPVAA